MKYRDETSMGGPDDNFQKTPWTQIIHARTEDEGHKRAAVAELLRNYWKPVYCYLRSKGYGNEPAKDLVQGFFHEVVLGRDLIQQADPAQGRFRRFLLTALDRYAASAHRAETAEKRRPEGTLLSLGGGDPPELSVVSEKSTPEEAFHCAWASAVLDEVLEAVKRLCHENGQSIHWEVFRDRVVRPIMDGEAPPALRELCEKHGIREKARVSTMVFTVKRRFRMVLRRRMRKFVGSDGEADPEIQELIRILSRK